jgi:hypothetical protein
MDVPSREELVREREDIVVDCWGFVELAARGVAEALAALDAAMQAVDGEEHLHAQAVRADLESVGDAEGEEAEECRAALAQELALLADARRTREACCERLARVHDRLTADAETLRRAAEYVRAMGARTGRSLGTLLQERAVPAELHRGEGKGEN